LVHAQDAAAAASMGSFANSAPLFIVIGSWMGASSVGTARDKLSLATAVYEKQLEEVASEDANR